MSGRKVEVWSTVVIGLLLLVICKVQLGLAVDAFDRALGTISGIAALIALVIAFAREGGK